MYLFWLLFVLRLMTSSRSLIPPKKCEIKGFLLVLQSKPGKSWHVFAFYVCLIFLWNNICIQSWPLSMQAELWAAQSSA